MDSLGPLVHTKIHIKPSPQLVDYLGEISFNDDMPENIAKFIKGINNRDTKKGGGINTKVNVDLTSDEIATLEQLMDDFKDTDVKKEELNGQATGVDNTGNKKSNKHDQSSRNITATSVDDTDIKDSIKDEQSGSKGEIALMKTVDSILLTVGDIDWLYVHLQVLRVKEGKDVPYLHELFEGSEIITPENEVIKRNPVLEARCIKLRAQQEAREYRAMTKGVDNVRVRYPEDSISYQLKQLNRQLIAVGQFLLSIFAGFMFGFTGLQLMIGGIDFGVRLILGVMCALVIALAEIYFLAKKLNEELSIPETTQIGGPPKFANQPDAHARVNKIQSSKERQD